MAPVTPVDRPLAALNRGERPVGHGAGISLLGHVGTLRSVGFKFGGWHDTQLMRRPLG